MGYSSLATVDMGASRVLEGEQWIDRLLERIDDRPYRPGRWAPQDVGEHMQTRWARLVQHMIDSGLDERSSISEATMIMRDTAPPERVYRNGPHEMLMELALGGPDLDREILGQLDRMLVDFPIPGDMPLRLSIVSRVDMGGGWTIRPQEDRPYSPVILLGDDVFGGGTVHTSRPGFAMPVYYTLGPSERWRYVLAHEWGHVAHNGEDIDYRGPGLSEYGAKRREAVAEAFAEWFLTGGATDNPAARAYAQHYGWRVPRG